MSSSASPPVRGHAVEGTPTPKRIQLHRTRGWHKPAGAIVVARPSKWGNPYVVGTEMTVSLPGADGLWYDGMTLIVSPTTAVDLYRQLMEIRLDESGLTHDDDITDARGWQRSLAALRGHDLACWCPLDAPCHADHLLDLAN